MIQSRLFNDKSFRLEADTITNKVRRAIELLDKAAFDNSSAEAIISSLYDANQMGDVFINTESITQTIPEDVRVPTFDETAPNSSVLADGTRFGFKIPFVGNAALLNLRPDVNPNDLPFGEIKADHLFFQLEQVAADDVTATLVQYQNNIARYNTTIAALASDIDDFNAGLLQLITTAVNARKARIDKKYADAALFEVPIA